MVSETLKRDIKKICLRNPHIEVCGVICDNRAIEIKNIHHNPTKQFKLCPKEQVAATIMNGDIEYVFHSHINSKGPSFNDKYACNLHNINIITYDIYNDNFYVNHPQGHSSYLNKNFEIGKNDCYELVRNYYQTELGIKLGHYIRFENWFELDPFLFDKNFEKQGFTVVHNGAIDENTKLEENDCILFSMIQEQEGCNHIGIYMGNNQMLHHPRNKPSRIQELTDSYKRYCKYIIRHEKVTSKNTKKHNKTLQEK